MSCGRSGCPGQDSNRDALRRCPLKTVCLPVSPPGRVKKGRIGPLGGQPMRRRAPVCTRLVPHGTLGRVRLRGADWRVHRDDHRPTARGGARRCCSTVLNGVLAEREGTLKELGVKLVRNIPHELPMVACPMAQLTEMLMKLLDFALRRLRDSQPPRELRIAVSETGPSLTISLWDSGTPLSVEAEQRLVTPFRFTQSAGGGEIEFALARALAQSSGGTLRLRPRPGGGAEVVVTLPKSVLAPLARATAATPSLPKLRILVVDDDAVNRQAMRLLLEREGHEVVAVEQQAH